MEPLYPQNILERHLPILREQRERREREQVYEGAPLKGEAPALASVGREAFLYENEPADSGPIGRSLNTVA